MYNSVLYEKLYTPDKALINVVIVFAAVISQLVKTLRFVQTSF